MSANEPHQDPELLPEAPPAESLPEPEPDQEAPSHHHHHHHHHRHHHHHHSHSHSSHSSSTDGGSEEPDDEEETVHHHHRRRHSTRSRLRSFLYYLLSFFLSVTLFLLALLAVLYMTMFSQDHMIKTMRSDGYYQMVGSEFQSRLEDLCDASGFDRSFADQFVKNYNIKKAVEDYIHSFYTGDNTLVETTAFKQQLYSAIDTYRAEKGIAESESSQKNLAYFVDEATDMYVNQISIPFFSTIARYIDNTRTAVLISLAFLFFIALAIAAVIWFTNSYKHRRFRYLFIGFSGATLATFILPTVVLLSGKIQKVNLTDRSLYQLFVDYFSSIFYQVYIWAGMYFVLSGLLMVLFIRHFRRVLHS